MRMRMCMHTHTDRQECSVEWKIALGTTRPCMLCGIFFFSARARMFFLVSCVGDTYARYGRWVYIFLLEKKEGEKKKKKKLKRETLG